jgi:hypothetical protein
LNNACDPGWECIDTTTGALCVASSTDDLIVEDGKQDGARTTRRSTVKRVLNVTQSALEKQKALIERLRTSIQSVRLNGTGATRRVVPPTTSASSSEETVAAAKSVPLVVHTTAAVEDSVPNVPMVNEGMARYGANLNTRRPDTASGSGPHDCSNRYPSCKDEWEVCCPGRSGGPQCGDPDCNADRKPGKPCLGIFMQLECPRVCGLCDNHDLARTSTVERGIEAVERESSAEIEALQAAFQKVSIC